MSANCGDTTRGSGGRDHLPLTPLVPFSLPSCLVFPLLLPFFFLLFSSRTFFLFPFPLILCLLTFIIPLLLLLFLLYAPPVTTCSSLLVLSDFLFPLRYHLSDFLVSSFCLYLIPFGPLSLRLLSSQFVFPFYLFLSPFMFPPSLLNLPLLYPLPPPPSHSCPLVSSHLPLLHLLSPFLLRHRHILTSLLTSHLLSSFISFNFLTRLLFFSNASSQQMRSLILKPFDLDLQSSDQ